MLYERFIHFFKLVVVCLPIFVLAHVVWLCGVNLVYMDDFEPIADFIDIINNKTIDWTALFALHNEHRIVFPRIITYIIAYFTHYNTKFIMLFSVMLLACGYLIFIKETIAKKIQDFNFYDLLYSLVIGFCLFNFCQSDNLLWGFQVAWFLIEFCAIAGLKALNEYIKTNQLKWAIIFITLAVISSFSSLHGLIIWIIYFIVSLLSQFEDRKINYKLNLLIIIPAIIVFGLYFIDYHEVSYHANAKTSGLKATLEFFFMNLGCVLSKSNLLSDYMIAGILEVMITIILGLWLLINKQLKQNIFPLGLIGVSFSIALMLGLGRSGWNAMPSRYMTFPLLAVIGNLALLKSLASQETVRKIFAIIVFTIMTFACLDTSFNALKGYNRLQIIKLTGVEFMRNYKAAPLQYLQILYPFKTRDDALARIEKIEKAELSVFYENKENIK